MTLEKIILGLSYLVVDKYLWKSFFGGCAQKRSLNVIVKGEIVEPLARSIWENKQMTAVAKNRKFVTCQGKKLVSRLATITRFFNPFSDPNRLQLICDSRSEHWRYTAVLWDWWQCHLHGRWQTGQPCDAVSHWHLYADRSSWQCPACSLWH